MPTVQSNGFILQADTTTIPGATTTSTTTTGTTTTTTTTSFYPKDFPCSHAKGKKIDCNERNMHTGMTLVNYIMQLSNKERSKVKSLDVSNNPDLSFPVLMSIMGHLENLSSLVARHNGWKIIPSNLFNLNRKVKSLDITDNDVQCLRNVFKHLKMKKMAFAHNPKLQDLVGAKKGKKSKLVKYIEEFNKMPRDWCVRPEDAGEMSVHV